MSEAWWAFLFVDEDQARLAERDPVAPATRSETAFEKAASKQLADGSPAHSFRTLLHELSAIERTQHHGAHQLSAVTMPSPETRSSRSGSALIYRMIALLNH
ncbi:hypothetical protein G3480_13785 [Thiorhodococcus mannitoliphagus]|uniref:Uncharacterized protein n=1 Tax=Thiorhodococcus mannitoliphagus TaxID=329406 RepID=A0A6P1DV67_9GAMM|nr:hypothetical protein [Thiorhodococcus mannitoliphagus]NEX21370.1 hypothetical protein [Thiorhodococcus mannitoliphagus]